METENLGDTWKMENAKFICKNCFKAEKSLL